MKYLELLNSAPNANEGTLIKVESTAELTEAGFLVTKAKETFEFFSEEEADEMINNVRQMSEFVGAEKKFKKGKVNKNGEVIKPEAWQVIVKLAY